MSNEKRYMNEEEMMKWYEEYLQKRRQKLREIFQDKTFGLIENVVHLEASRDLMTHSYGARQLYTTPYAPEDLATWVENKKLDALLIHAQTLYELEQVLRLHNTGFKVGVILRNVGGAFVDGYLDKIDDLRSKKVLLFNKLMGAAELSLAFAKLLGYDEEDLVSTS